ncbi:response regulator transcription factor [Psychrobium sp. MM17-31]|uniref:response regulator transcription factor n=1 Tax=Psychrobium sp. MM17-31 TaxID=2917758 RepID=UPI001EF6338E|nr:response regulator transcription factor [Psychrobium sp. MM17-31]MCG7530942.1 response regulator transcription factor [Psychrobium sp. MM17-31]
MKKAHVLLVEDDAEISRLTTMYLEAEGYTVTTIDDGALAIDSIVRINPDLVILDLMLPRMNGIEVCKKARDFYTNPILVLTACDDDISEVSLLRQGADDYLVKPLKPHVLVARIEALTRRSMRQQPAVDKVIEIHSQQVFCRGIKLELTNAEFEMLKILVDNEGDIVSREECCQALRGIDYDFSNRSIDMRISGLRKKLGDDQMPYQIITTVRNKGYKLIND